MSTALPVTLLLTKDLATTSRKVWQVVEATKRVNDVYESTEVLLRATIFQQPFLKGITQQIVEVSKEVTNTFLNHAPFTTETYREAREAHELLGNCLEILTKLREMTTDWERFPKDYHPLLQAVRQMFQTLTECHAHLSNRFDEMDAVQSDVTQSKYLRRVKGSERWNSRPSVYEYQV
jgi:hypothetical protein